MPDDGTSRDMRVVVSGVTTSPRRPSHVPFNHKTFPLFVAIKTVDGQSNVNLTYNVVKVGGGGVKPLFTYGPSLVGLCWRRRSTRVSALGGR